MKNRLRKQVSMKSWEFFIDSYTEYNRHSEIIRVESKRKNVSSKGKEIQT